jgi:hypothetical protein
MIEVRKGILGDGSTARLYPKVIAEPNVNINYNEYRFFCQKCKKE